MSKITRRQAILTSASVAVSIPLGLLKVNLASAAGHAKLDPEDPTAKALEYVHESTTEGQFCNNCQLYTGADDVEWGPCSIFPGKEVAAKGWCKSWVKKAG